MRLITSSLAIFLSFSLYATDYRPWSFERDFEIYPRLDYAFQHYSRVATASGSQHLSANTHFVTAAVGASYGVYSGEAEVVCLGTPDSHPSFGFDYAKVTGRYHWRNDVIGDPLSLTFGISGAAVSFFGLHDLSAFHLGRFEGQLFLSLGKECVDKDTWSSRWWGVFALCLGDRGSPGIFSRWSWEKHSFPYEWGIFAEFLGGLGNRSLHLHSFSGYGSIRYRAVDLGIKVHKLTSCDAILEGEIKQRVWARHFPKGATVIQVSYIYPFGL